MPDYTQNSAITGRHRLAVLLPRAIADTAANGAVLPDSQRALHALVESLQFIERHAHELHKVWTYGLALGVSIWALGWQGD